MNENLSPIQIAEKLATLLGWARKSFMEEAPQVDGWGNPLPPTTNAPQLIPGEEVWIGSETLFGFHLKVAREYPIGEDWFDPARNLSQAQKIRDHIVGHTENPMQMCLALLHSSALYSTAGPLTTQICASHSREERIKIALDEIEIFIKKCKKWEQTNPPGTMSKGIAVWIAQMLERTLLQFPQLPGALQESGNSPDQVERLLLGFFSALYGLVCEMNLFLSEPPGIKDE